MTRGFNSIVECTDQLAHHSQNVEHSLLVCWTGKEKPATRGHTRPSVSISMIKTFSLQTAIWTVNLVQLWFHHHQTAYMVYLVIYHVFFPPFLNLILSVKFHLKCLCFAQFEIALENNTWCCLRAEKYFEEMEPASVCVCARILSKWPTVVVSTNILFHFLTPPSRLFGLSPVTLTDCSAPPFGVIYGVKILSIRIEGFSFSFLYNILFCFHF